MTTEKYYLILVGSRGKKFNPPYLIGLQSMELKDKDRRINWMKIGQGEFDDYRVAKRIEANKFECVDTNEIYTITDRCAFTIDAWNNFINNF